MKYEVQQHTLCDGWSNNWRICEKDGSELPHQFDTMQEAQAELDEFFEDIADEIRRGERHKNEGYDREEFRIIPVEPANPD
jgi:hypothetical protein